MKYLFWLFSFITNAVFSQIYNLRLEDKKLTQPLVPDTAVEHWDESFPSYFVLNNEEKQLIYWTNYSRNNPKRFWDSVINPILNIYPQLKGEFSESLKRDVSKSYKLPLFAINTSLTKMAKKHALEIGEKSYPLSHNSPDGTTFSDRFFKSGLYNCGGENLSLSDNILLGLVLLYLDFGLPDGGHRKNLLSQQFTNLGVGVCKYGKDGNLLFVQDFACNQ